MRIALAHEWKLSPPEAERLQNELRRRVTTSDQIPEVHAVAGVDVGFAGPDTARAAIVVLSYPSLATLEIATAQCPVTFPYIPGLLSFREAPVILAAAEQLRREPDLILVDGQGIAHPRRLGIAAHLGVLLDKPAIGCAKSRLIGRHDPVGPNPGDLAYLYDGDEIIGAALRTKARCNPLYVSIGNKIDLSTAIRFVLATSRGYRLPEPTRRAHLAAAGRLQLDREEAKG